jgi:hypothetical protein
MSSTNNPSYNYFPYNLRNQKWDNVEGFSLISSWGSCKGLLVHVLSFFHIYFVTHNQRYYIAYSTNNYPINIGETLNKYHNVATSMTQQKHNQVNKHITHSKHSTASFTSYRKVNHSTKYTYTWINIVVGRHLRHREYITCYSLSWLVLPA